MRALIATSTFPLHPEDGTPRFVLDLAAALVRHVSVTVLAPGAPGAPARERWRGVEVRRFGYFLPRARQQLAYGAGMPANLAASRLARMQVPAFLACEARALRALAREMRADVVHSHWLLPQGLVAAWARGRRARFAHVATLHGSDAHLLARLPGARAIARRVCARCDVLVAAATPLRERLDRTLGHLSDALVRPVGVDSARFRGAAPATSPFPGGFLLFTGRLVAGKGVDVLLRALPRVRERHPRLGLVVLGDGPEAGPLRAQAGALGLARWVRFAGRAGAATVAAHLRACRAAVVPSRVAADGSAEGMPAVILEAMAAGARLVASNAGGIRDVVKDGANGWLARPGDAGSLAAVLLAALDTPVPPGARETAEAHDWTLVAEAHLALYERAVRRAARA